MSWKNGQFESQIAITPDDDNDLARPTDGLAVNVAGDVKMTLKGGQTVTRTLLAGVDYEYTVTRIHATDTNATGIHALYLD